MSENEEEGSFPEPLDSPEVGVALRTGYTAELKALGVRGSVTVSVDIDENGIVTNAVAVSPPPLPDNERLFNIMDKGNGDGEELKRRFEELTDPSMIGDLLRAINDGSIDPNISLAPPDSDHPELQRIAEAAARAQRFSPSMKDGAPVAFEDYRMSFVFSGK